MKKGIITTLKDGEYKVGYKLGAGRFSTCWSANTKDNEFAIKVYKLKQDKMANAEIEFYKLIQGECDNVLKLYDTFEEKGGVCLVFDKMDKKNLLDIIEDSKTGLELPVVKDITRQILKGLEFLHKNGIIHSDLKPENILLRKREDGNYDVKIGDLGGAYLLDDDDRNPDIGTTEYKSPEVIIGSGYNTTTDIWACACIIFEMLTNNFLFDPHSFCGNSESSSSSSSSNSDSETDDEEYEKRLLIDQMHLWLMSKTLGEIPMYISRRGANFEDFFHRAGNIRNVPHFIKEKNIKTLLIFDYNFSEEDATNIEAFLLPMLSYDTEKRLSATEILTNPFLAETQES